MSIVGQLTQSHSDDGDYQIYFYIFLWCSPLFPHLYSSPKVCVCPMARTWAKLFVTLKGYCKFFFFNYFFVLDFLSRKWIVESIWNSFTPASPCVTLPKCYITTRNIFSILNLKLVGNIKCNGYVFQYFRHSGVLYMCIVKLWKRSSLLQIRINQTNLIHGSDWNVIGSNALICGRAFFCFGAERNSFVWANERQPQDQNNIVQTQEGSTRR